LLTISSIDSKQSLSAYIEKLTLGKKMLDKLWKLGNEQTVPPTLLVKAVPPILLVKAKSTQHLNTEVLSIVLHVLDKR
jgi:hypothetical protein